MNFEPRSGVSASIVIYKTEVKEIEALIADMLRQGVAKVYVIDNGPTKLNARRRLIPSVEYEYISTGENLGYGRAHNIAIGLAVDRFRYHLICNPDIKLSAGVVDRLVRYMDSHEDVGLCMPSLRGVDGELQYCCRRSPIAWDYISQLISPGFLGRHRAMRLEMRDCDYQLEMDVQCLSGCFMFFRAAILKALKGFDEQFFLYFEDFDLSNRAQKLSRNIYIPDISVTHERQSAHRRSWRLRLVFAISAIRYFKKWGAFGWGLNRPN